MRETEFAKAGHLTTLISSFLYLTVHCMIWVLLGNLTVFIAQDFDLSASQQGALAAAPILSDSEMRSGLRPGLLALSAGLVDLFCRCCWDLSRI